MIIKVNKNLPVLDYLKGYAIFTIVLFHLITLYNFFDWPGIVKTAANFGGAGVHVFIVCSGFGLYLSHINKPVHYFNFLKKRFLKVYVPYMVVVLVSASIPFMYGGEKVPALLSHAFLYKMFFQTYETSFGVQFWFISTIIQFYLVFPILTKVKERLGNNKYMLFSIVVSLVYALAVVVLGKEGFRTWSSFFLQYLWEFSLGMIFVDYYRKSRFKQPNIMLLLILSITGLLITGITGYIGGVFKLFNDSTSLAGYGGLSLSIYLFNSFFIWISKFSYEWYLVHILVFSCVQHMFKENIPSVAILIFAFCLSIVVAMLLDFVNNKMFTKLTTKKLVSSPGSSYTFSNK